MATVPRRLGTLVIATFVTTHAVAGEAKDPLTALELEFAGVEKILVLPAVDVRNGEKASVKLENIQKHVLNILKKKNYSIEAAAFSNEAVDVVEEDLKEAKPEWVRTLGAPDARWVMVVCLNDVTSKLTFGSTGNAELSGYLYDKQDGRLVWQDKGIGQAGQGGLAGMMFKGTMKGQALSIAVNNLMRSVPKRPKAKK